MRKLIVPALLLNAALLFAIWQELSVVAEVGGGAGASPCDTDQTKYSLDTNDDGGIDLSDFVYGLQWFFQGTEAPRVCLATDALEARIAALETLLSDVSIVQFDDGQEGTAKTLRITGCNLQIVNGLDDTDTTNGVGNLIVGYQELRGAGDDRTGSHNVVVGALHTYSSYGGLVVGSENTISGIYSSVIAGERNVASGGLSSVTAGAGNTASANTSSVSGGEFNTASGRSSSVSGGSKNTASGTWSSVCGGQFFAS